MEFKKQGSVYKLSAKMNLPIDLDQAWDFFSDPSNLKVITPDYMGFHIISDDFQKMYEGQFISYKVSPLLGIKLNWVSEITHVEHKQFFVDEQRVGPYTIWHHKHFFKELKDGVEMIDVVYYKLPLSFIANRMHGILVEPKLRQIFDYRTQSLTKLFGTY